MALENGREMGKSALQMRRWFRRLMLGVLLLAIAVAAGLYWLGTGGYRYSDEQQALIDQSGKPDGFVIGFSTDADSNPERFELWYYHSLGTAVHFVNGIATQAEPIDALPDDVLLPPYEPAEFDRYMTRGHVMDIVAPGPWASAPEYFPELFADQEIEIHYGEQLVLGVDAESQRLVYVETMALRPDEQ